jgi:ubiquinone/menaquinone biosynthesis C-methylase UbiE
MKKYVVDGRDEIKRFYAETELVEKYEETRFQHPIWRLSHQKEVAVANSLLRRIRPDRILDLALGTGRVSRALGDYRVGTGIDINEKMLLKSRASLSRDEDNRQRWSLVKADAFRLPFSESSFDVVIAFRFVRHFRRRDRRELFNEVNRVLSPGGFFIFEALNANMGEFAIRLAGLNQFQIYDELWSSGTLQEEVEESGFRLHSLHPILNQIHFLWFVHRGFAKLRLNSISPFFLRIFDRFPANHPYEWGVICRKN